MVWEDIEEDEHGLLESARYPARQRHYRALGGGLLNFLILYCIGLVIVLLVILWVIK